ncbi:hypothetical protein DRN86_01190 [Candidatus Geothermarchaeota archaeon]|nr:MAG: hypothetical protein DRN86_01190 [Candidatus Geothermarchaeota archaeon]
MPHRPVDVNSTVQTTPYVRECEDLAEMGIVFSAPYIERKMEGRHTLLGKYDTVEDIVQWKLQILVQD